MRRSEIYPDCKACTSHGRSLRCDHPARFLPELEEVAGGRDD